MADAAFLQKRARLRRQQRQGQIPAPDLVDLQSGSPLGIFSGPTEQPADSGAVATWRACQARELSVISVPAPRNAIEEMVLWTKQGKLWHFPVDNEQGRNHYTKNKNNFHFRILQDWITQMIRFTTTCSWSTTSSPGARGPALSDISWKLSVLAFRKIRM